MPSAEKSVNSSLVAATQQETRPRPEKRRTQKYSEKEEKYPTRIGTKNDPCPWHLTRYRPAEYRAQYGEEPPEANKTDSEFDKWKQKRRPKKDVAVPELYCKKDGTLNLCRECFLHWLLGTKPGKRHNGGLFCCHERHKKHKSHKKAKHREENQPGRQSVNVPVKIPPDNQSGASGNSNLSFGQELARKANMTEDELMHRVNEAKETDLHPQTVQPGLGPEESAEAEMSPSTGANGDLTEMDLGKKGDKILTTAEETVILDFVDGVWAL